MPLTKGKAIKDLQDGVDLGALDVSVSGHFSNHPAPTNRDTRNEPADATILKDADIGVSVHGQDADFSGSLGGYTEAATAVTITTGSGTLDMATTENLRSVAIIANTVITVSNLVANKPITLALTQTAGPFTLGLAYGAKTISVTLNGAAGEALETVEVWCDGTDLFVPTDGGVLWTVGV